MHSNTLHLCHIPTLHTTPTHPFCTQHLKWTLNRHPEIQGITASLTLTSRVCTHPLYTLPYHTSTMHTPSHSHYTLLVHTHLHTTHTPISGTSYVMRAIMLRDLGLGTRLWVIIIPSPPPTPLRWPKCKYSEGGGHAISFILTISKHSVSLVQHNALTCDVSMPCGCHRNRCGCSHLIRAILRKVLSTMHIHVTVGGSVGSPL